VRFGRLTEDPFHAQLGIANLTAIWPNLAERGVHTTFSAPTQSSTPIKWATTNEQSLEHESPSFALRFLWTSSMTACEAGSPANPSSGTRTAAANFNDS
jgi:hypothetical protein